MNQGRPALGPDRLPRAEEAGDWCRVGPVAPRAAPANPVGHALAVVEMLVGQLCLVTVIGMLASSLARGDRTGPREASHG